MKTRLDQLTMKVVPIISKKKKKEKIIENPVKASTEEQGENESSST